jgi:hypothetical protein
MAMRYRPHPVRAIHWQFLESGNLPRTTPRSPHFCPGNLPAASPYLWQHFNHQGCAIGNLAKNGIITCGISTEQTPAFCRAFLEQTKLISLLQRRAK